MGTMSTTSSTRQLERDDEPMKDTEEPSLDDLTDDVELVLRKKFKIGKDLMDSTMRKSSTSSRHTSIFSPGTCMTCLGLTFLLLHIN